MSRGQRSLLIASAVAVAPVRSTQPTTQVGINRANKFGAMVTGFWSAIPAGMVNQDTGAIASLVAGAGAISNDGDRITINNQIGGGESDAYIQLSSDAQFQTAYGSSPGTYVVLCTPTATQGGFPYITGLMCSYNQPGGGATLRFGNGNSGNSLKPFAGYRSTSGDVEVISAASVALNAESVIGGGWTSGVRVWAAANGGMQAVTTSGNVMQPTQSPRRLIGGDDYTDGNFRRGFTGPMRACVALNQDLSQADWQEFSANIWQALNP
jgi:hypothetical protein